MQLIGMLDSPYVRRAAISGLMMGLVFEHRSISVFRHIDAFRAINPLVKAPTLVCEDKDIIVDSQLILDYFESLVAPEKRLMPIELASRKRALHVIGVALVACEKTVQHLYETQLRPPERQHAPWIDRVKNQLEDAWKLLEPIAAKASPWLAGERLTQADITLAVAWRFNQFSQPGLSNAAHYPSIAALSMCAEALSEFMAYPVDKE
ncbi:MAG TPA: glutathione S-transferase [Rhodocyclaceae bacterium]|nr:glutathione S-transferase [Rhodocyclaceae bacterium]